MELSSDSTWGVLRLSHRRVRRQERPSRVWAVWQYSCMAMEPVWLHFQEWLLSVPKSRFPGSPSLGQHAPQACKEAVQWVCASQVRSHLYEFRGLPPKLSCVTTPSVTSYEVPDPP